MAASTDADWSPPLVTELFDARFRSVLDKYPVAQSAAADIRREQAMANPRTLEQFIAERYRDGAHPMDKRKYYALTYYLQDLLWQVTEKYTSHPDNYDLLITGLQSREVIYITLNYDTLLDGRLAHFGSTRFNSVQSYVNPHAGFSLIKLHGSVNWGLGITTPGVQSEVFTQPPAELEWDNLHMSSLPSTEGTGLDSVRRRSSPPPHLYFPMLSVPQGQDDLLTCPDEHVEYLRNRLAEAEMIDLLILGYSGYDREVIKLINDAQREVRSLFVVNRDRATAGEVFDRIRNGIGVIPPHSDVYDGTFGGFVQHDGLDRYNDWLDRARSYGARRGPVVNAAIHRDHPTAGDLS